MNDKIKQIQKLASSGNECIHSVNDLIGKLLQIEEICEEVLAGESDDN